MNLSANVPTTSVPEVPYFVVSELRHGIDLLHKLERHVNTNRLALITNWDRDWIVYDANGFVWSRRFERPRRGFSFASRVLANTFYNPVVTVAIEWEPIRRYSLDELQRRFLDVLENDDDILTQFVDRDELADRIRACCTFADIVAVWNWMKNDELAAETQ